MFMFLCWHATFSRSSSVILNTFIPFLDSNAFSHTTNPVVSLQKTSFKLTTAIAFIMTTNSFKFVHSVVDCYFTLTLVILHF